MQGFFIDDIDSVALIFLTLLLFGFQEINVAQCCGKTDQHRYDGNKDVRSVSDVLLKHDCFCFHCKSICFGAIGK
jgi:hypothetical protein